MRTARLPGAAEGGAEGEGMQGRVGGRGRGGRRKEEGGGVGHGQGGRTGREAGVARSFEVPTETKEERTRGRKAWMEEEHGGKGVDAGTGAGGMDGGGRHLFRLLTKFTTKQ